MLLFFYKQLSFSVNFHDNEFWFYKPDRVFRRFRFFSRNFGDTFQADHVFHSLHLPAQSVKAIEQGVKVVQS